MPLASLPPFYSCIIRFPSTQIKLALTSLIEDMPPPLPPPISPIQPLRIDTTLTSPFVSPMPSPTGTIRSGPASMSPTTLVNCSPHLTVQ